MLEESQSSPKNPTEIAWGAESGARLAAQIVKLAEPGAPERETLSSLLADFSKKRVLVIGDMVADHYIFGQTDRVSREAPVLIVRFESSEVRLGGAANAAANIRALGANVTALGLIGRDEMGKEMRQLCRKQGIELISPAIKGFQTEAKTRILAGGHNTRRQQMLRLDRGCEGRLAAEVETELAGMLKELATKADAVLVSDYGAGVLGESVIAQLLALSKNGLPVCVDSRYNLRAFAGATLLKPNEPELEALAGMKADSDDRLVKAIESIRAELKIESMVVTRGRNGMAILEKGKISFLAAHGTKEAVDVTGAGDTVGSAITLGLAAGGSFEASARLANIAGALKVLKPGTATVSADELAYEVGTVGK